MTDFLYGGDSTVLFSSANLQLSEDDNVLVQGILNDPWALGFFGYSYTLERDFPLEVLAVNGLKPEDGTEYLLSRPLFLYLDADSIEEHPAPAEFIAYVLNRAGEGNLPRGFFPAETAAIEEGLMELETLRREAKP
jgi:phosphate transport system substrate-binding protein